MPKATLEFNLPEEWTEHADAVKGAEYRCALEEIRESIRGWRKYGHEFKIVDDALEMFWKVFHEATENTLDDRP